MREMNSIEMMRHAMKCTTAIDLSYTMEPGMPAWPTQARYGSVVYESYEYGDAALHSMITMSEHTGTHIDAPKHFIPNACGVDELSVTAVIGRGVMIDATSVKACETLSLVDIKQFEAKNGAIEAGDIIMLRFGWDKKYRLQPHSAAFLKDWPGLAVEAAAYLAEKCVAAVGCDTLSLDVFGSDNPCHPLLLGKDIPIIENLCNLAKLPAFCFVVGLPNKFKGGSASPIRMAAFVDNGT